MPGKRKFKFLMFRAGLRGWLQAAKNDKLGNSNLRLGAFIDPELVLNSLRQKTCRALGTSLDKLKLVTIFGNRTERCKIYLTVPNYLF